MFAYSSNSRYYLWFFKAALWIVSAQFISAQVIPANGAVSSGTSYTLALKADGTVWAWGQNNFGQLGLGNTTAMPFPVSIPGLTNVSVIATGDAHSIALRTDGTVRTWGKNTNSQLGNTLTANLSTPYQPTSLTGIIAVAAGDNHSLFLKSDGTVWACGLNTNGQLGRGNTTATSAIVQVKGPGGSGFLTGISAIAAGADHSLALKSSDGTVYTWGTNSNGQIGDGTTTSPRTSPYQIPVAILSGVTAIAAGDAFSIALRSDNTVSAWGLNSSGQLGDGTTAQRTLPVTVASLAGVSAIAAGDTHVLALKANGTAFAWGLNSFGQLGDGTTSNNTTPVQIPGVTSAVALAGGTNHSHLILSDGRMLSFGSNNSGQLGDGLASSRSFTQIQPTTWTNVSAIAAGLYYTLAIRGNSTVWAWGKNDSGQLGDGSILYRATPIQIPGLNSITKVAAGNSHSVALTSNGTLRTWGFNTYGQLGNGNTTQSLVPIVPLSNPTGITAIAAGAYHSLALKSDGTILSWGLNADGQLGSGSTTNLSNPYQITTIANGTAISAGRSHSVALKSDGSVWSWGANYYGTLGDNSGLPRFSPVQVKGISGVGNLTSVAAIAAGGYHTLALKSDGTVYAWGLNSNGQLGDNSTIQRLAPVQVKGLGGVGNLTGVTAIAAGDNFSLAVLSDGTACSWGINNPYGQLGNGNSTDSTYPVTITGLASVFTIRGGWTHAVAIRQDQTLRIWGDNNYNALGSSGFPLSAAAISLKTNGGDGDADGLPDAWESVNWGNLAQSGSADSDRDGLTNVQEYLRGTNPNQPDADLDLLTDPVDPYPADYFNAITPTLTILSGNNQTTPFGQFNPFAFDVAVWSADATVPLVNAPVTFTVLSGGGQLAVTAAPPLSTTLTRRTDIDGTIDAFYQQPSVAGTSQIRVTAGTAQATFTTNSSDSIAPSIPFGLTSASITASSFTLTWSPSTDVGSLVSTLVYDVYLGGALLGTTAPGVTSYSVTGLSPSTVHSMAVRARDSSGNFSAQSPAFLVTTIADIIAPSVPTGLSSSAVTASSFTLNWSASSDNASSSSSIIYQVYLNGALVGTTGAGVTTYSVSGLASYVTYSMTVLARDAANNSSPQSATLNVTTAENIAPSVPAGLTSTAVTASSFTLNWAPSSDNVSAPSAIVYQVFRNGTLLGTTAAGITTYSVSGLASSVTYSMTVLARDAANNSSAQSAAFNVTTADNITPSVPAGLSSVAVTATSFTLNWIASSDNVSAPSAIVYQVYRNGSLLATTGAGITSFSVTGLTPSTGYTMTVRARDVAGNLSAQSTGLLVTTTADNIAPSIPTGLSSSSVTASSFSLNWAPSSDNVSASSAIVYQVFRNGTLVGTTGAGVTTYSVSGLISSVTYSMTVLARDAANNSSAQSTAFNVTTADNIGPSVPSGLVSSAITPGSFTLSWSAATDNVSASSALVYDVYRSGNFLGTTLAGITSYPVTGLASSALYSMTVRARDTAGNSSAQSTGLGVTTAVNPYQVAAGYDFTLALRSDGSIWSWGNNAYGQLGLGSTTQIVYPIRIAILDSVKTIAAGRTYGLAVKSDGTVWGWGDNYYGQLGDGTTDSRLSPVQIASSTLTAVVAVAAAQYHSLALRADGTVWAWGYNGYGQLGDGSITSRNQPGLVPGLTNVVAIAACSTTSFALKSDGTVWAWGSGYLGAGSSMTSSLVPIMANTVDKVVAISCSYNHVLALKSDGSLWAWGYNSDGQLGDGTTNSTYTAMAVPLTGQYTAIAAGYYHSLAIRSDGTAFAWGSNANGRLGLGSSTSQFTTPQSLGTPVLATTLAASNHSVWVAPYAGIPDAPLVYYSAGLNDYGQLGDTTTTDRSSPVPVAFASDLDLDGDGLSNSLEVSVGSNPLNADSNGDRLPDNVAYSSGYSLTSNDTDGDGLSNAFELASGLDPLRADTDGDGVNDATDAYPLDASVSSGSTQQGDITPPVITLTAPLGAILLP